MRHRLLCHVLVANFKSMTEETVPSSELGTREYWEKTYIEERDNFIDHGDMGEIWFGESTMKRVVKWMKHCQLIDKSAAILDLGCGNGVFLLEMQKAGFTNLTGVDYSESAIQLATDVVAAQKKLSEIQLEVGNILETQEENNCLCVAFNKKYHICTDKGTYDAISLDPDDASGKCKLYVSNVHWLLRNNGLLVLTSCNWTKEELDVRFTENFEIFEEIPMAQFQFGGMKGQRVTSLVLRARTQAKADT